MLNEKLDRMQEKSGQPESEQVLKRISCPKIGIGLVAVIQSAVCGEQQAQKEECGETNRGNAQAARNYLGSRTAGLHHRKGRLEECVEDKGGSREKMTKRHQSNEIGDFTYTSCTSR